MYYYAYLDDRDIVQMVLALPSQITDSRYILIPTNDQTLIGKRYNRETGQFEDVIMYYYAVLGIKDIVTEVISSETEITDPDKIQIPSNDTTLIGKWYNRQTGEFREPPIHVLAELDTQQINIVGKDKWLQTELNEINGDLADLEHSSFGGYKCTFDIRENERTTAEWASETGKHYVFQFDTGLPGYFPKMIRIIDQNSYDDTLIAEFFIVRDSDGSVKNAYFDKTYVGVPIALSGTPSPIRVTSHDIEMDDSMGIAMGKRNDGSSYDEGGSAFFQELHPNGVSVLVREFNYTENTFSFFIKISAALVGAYTSMRLTGYVF